MQINSSPSGDKSQATQIIVALGILVFVTLIVLLYGGASSGDDTFIYMQYVRNALAGHGFTFNAGEPSYGCTSALWVFVMTPLVKLFGNNVWTWKIASSILFGLRASVLYLFVSRFRIGRVWALILTFAIVIEPHSFRWASSGMENSLAVLLLTVAGYLFWLCIRRPTIILVLFLAIVSALLPFARPEFVLLSLAISLFVIYAVKDRKLSMVYFLTAGVSALLLVTAVWFCFSALIPQSAEAKSIFLQPKRYSALLQCGIIIATGCLCPVGILILNRGTSQGARYWKLATMVCTGSAILYLGYQNHLVSSRYASYLCAPLVFAAVIVAAERLAAGAEHLDFAKVLIALHLLISVAVLVYLYPATRVGDYQDIRKVADFVSANTAPDARIALSEVGAFGFYSNRYVIDLVGLTDTATLVWARQNGGRLGRDRLETLLIDRGATYFIDTRSEEEMDRIRGRRLIFTPIFELKVQRDILTISGRPADTVWRVYEVKLK